MARLRSILVALVAFSFNSFCLADDGWLPSPDPASRVVTQRSVSSLSANLRSAVSNTVQVRFPSGGNSSNVGSGVYLGADYVATAYHVPRGTSGRGIVQFRDGTNIQCETVLIDQTFDQCILKLAQEHPSLPGVEIAQANPALGETVYSAGFGNGFRVFGGPVQGWGRPNVQGAPTDWFDHGNAAVSGDSGGPVFNQTGRLIGCLWGSDGRSTTASGAGRFHVFIKPLFPRLAAWRANRIARQVQGFGVLQPSRCYPGSSGLGCNMPGQVTVDYPSNATPTPPSLGSGLAKQPTPMAPIQGGSCNCNCEPANPSSALPAPSLAALSDADRDRLIEDLLARMKSDPDFRGPAGKDGADGMRGPAGRDGEAGQIKPEQLAAITSSILEIMQNDPKFRGPEGQRGPAGPGADIDVSALKQDILASINYPDRRVLLVDGQGGTVLDDETYGSDEPIVLDFQNIVRQARPR